MAWKSALGLGPGSASGYIYNFGLMPNLFESQFPYLGEDFDSNSYWNLLRWFRYKVSSVYGHVCIFLLMPSPQSQLLSSVFCTHLWALHLDSLTGAGLAFSFMTCSILSTPTSPASRFSFSNSSPPLSHLCVAQISGKQGEREGFKGIHHDARGF